MTVSLAENLIFVLVSPVCKIESPKNTSVVVVSPVTLKFPVTVDPVEVVSNFLFPEWYNSTAPPLMHCIKLVLSTLSLKTISSSASNFRSSPSLLITKSLVLLSMIEFEPL